MGQQRSAEQDPAILERSRGRGVVTTQHRAPHTAAAQLAEVGGTAAQLRGVWARSCGAAEAGRGAGSIFTRAAAVSCSQPRLGTMLQQRGGEERHPRR